MHEWVDEEKSDARRDQRDPEVTTFRIFHVRSSFPSDGAGQRIAVQLRRAAPSAEPLVSWLTASPRRLAFLERKDDPPITFHSCDRPAFRTSFVERVIQVPDGRRAIVPWIDWTRLFGVSCSALLSDESGSWRYSARISCYGRT